MRLQDAGGVHPEGTRGKFDSLRCLHKPGAVRIVRTGPEEGNYYAGVYPDPFAGECYHNPRLGRPDAFTDAGRSALSAPDRFMSPDPLGPGAFNLADRQTLDLYSYVRNSPTSLVDPVGLQQIDRSSPHVRDEGWCEWMNSFFLMNFYLYGEFNTFVISIGGCTPEGRHFATYTVPYLDPLADPWSGVRGGSSPQAQVSCSTAPPNGQTIGDLVRRQRASLLTTELVAETSLYPATVAPAALGQFISIVRPGGPIDFKNEFSGQANAAPLGQEGNFAHYAIGTGILSPLALDAGAGAYGLLTATFGPRPLSDLTGRTFSDSSAASVLDAAVASKGCIQ